MMLCAVFMLLTYKLQLHLVIQLIMLKYRMNNSLNYLLCLRRRGFADV
jgi:hypothetical protein